MKNKDL
jgi:hypothetical protein